MNCGNRFCVYYKNGRCILRKVELDCQGSCRECILVSIGEEKLQKERERFLNSKKGESTK